MRNILFLATSALIAAAAFSAHAADQDTWYIGVAGGANYLHSDKLDGNGFKNKATYDWGQVGAVTVGYQGFYGFRPEIEISYRENNVDKLSGTSRGVDGNVGATSAMLNVLYDVPVGNTDTTVYAGLGGGVSHIKYDTTLPVGGSVLDDSDTVLAAQAIVGARYKLSDSFDLFANYQFFNAFNPSFKTNAGSKVDTDYRASSGLVGVRYKLNQPKPVVAPAPEPAPIVAAPAPAPAPVSRDYLVFFDFDKSTLTPEGKNVLSQAASDAKAGNAVSLSVVGHTDTSGTASYNMALSKARAETVKKQLANLGIASGSIQTAAKGESDPLVPTADGVKEPQNRRAQVQFTITPQK